jgi:hypothetical protein
MSITELPSDTIHTIIVPSLTRDKKKIPSNKRKEIIRQIESSFSNANGGATTFFARGSYFSKPQNLVYEKVAVITSLGMNPFSTEDIEYLVKELDQEVIMRQLSSGNKAYFIDNEPSAVKKEKEINYPDESYEILLESEDDNGEPIYLAIWFDDREGPDCEYLGNIEEDEFEPLPDDVNSILQEQLIELLKMED